MQCLRIYEFALSGPQGLSTIFPHDRLLKYQILTTPKGSRWPGNVEIFDVFREQYYNNHQEPQYTPWSCHMS